MMKTLFGGQYPLKLKIYPLFFHGKEWFSTCSWPPYFPPSSFPHAVKKRLITAL